MASKLELAEISLSQEKDRVEQLMQQLDQSKVFIYLRTE